MKKILLLLAVAVVLSGLSGCGQDDPAGASKPDVYKYVGYDQSGAIVVIGYLIMENELDSGYWKLLAAGSQRDIGPQVGSGRLAIDPHDTLLVINLNPGMIDYNVYLLGKLENGVLSGTWNYSGYAGIMNHGTFIAAR